ncbi:uncharacterized protein AB675_5074 [Cyphellophora attinorum]|uniref:Uncharacterized protein n=1 Tax=Cyphellophora attinorum TaxID=1664694 RepID=A0A0N0NLN7_9EURO|nr:uncharacterized protein AB675_5074 [Phialophora attinorum]KPI39249.1 hypothetical protein AB675_5074 [Phialophora attinorum]
MSLGKNFKSLPNDKKKAITLHLVIQHAQEPNIQRSPKSSESLVLPRNRSRYLAIKKEWQKAYEDICNDAGLAVGANSDTAEAAPATPKKRKANGTDKAKTPAKKKSKAAEGDESKVKEEPKDDDGDGDNDVKDEVDDESVSA